ncbi:MAG: hypothetical protein OSJ72_15575 [Lachnospiraceae bacterium]|nr:hypothetical protein [Lachnospiraceae bacterium]
MKGKKAGRRIAAWLTAIVLMSGMLVGCGKSGLGADADGNAADGSGAAQGEAMGRYVEKDVDLGGNALTDWNSRLFKQADGSFRLVDNSGFVLRSTDGGASWTREDLPWLAKMKEEDKYIRTMAFGLDGTAAVVWTEPEEGSGEDGNGVQLKMDMQLTLVKPDGTLVPVTINLEPEDMCLNAVYIADNGRIFATAAGTNLYEVKEDGSAERYLTVDGYSLELVQFHGNLMLLDGLGIDVPLIYDMEEREYIEDQVLAEFVKANFADRQGYAGKSHDLFLFSGGADALYLAGQAGVYRHVLGGSTMEQVIDGELNILGNPACQIMDMIATSDDEFLVVLTGEKMTRFVYDPNVPARPNEKLAVWSLEEDEVIRQTLSKYQKDNPEIFVEYEIGLEGNTMTREDAIKNLNTRIMAGKGPDVLVLDNLPLASYIEKGTLLDMAPLLDGMSGEEAVTEFLVQTKRMYEAQTDGLPEEAVQTWEGDRAYYQEYESPNGEVLEESDAIRTRHQAVHLLGGRRQFVAGVIEDVWEYNSQLSVSKVEGFADCAGIPMEGQCSNVIRARTLLGINAASTYQKQAQDFIKMALGLEIQTDILDGISVLPKAIRNNYENQWRIYKDNDYVSGMSGTYDLNEEEIIMPIRVPDEKAVDALLQWISAMDTAYVEDKTFENVIYEEGERYILEDKSLEEAIDSIDARLGIYLAE